MNPFDKFDIIYYINLDKRKDRKNQILQELSNMNINMTKVKRIPGVISSLSCVGCSKAHLNALKDFEQNNYKNCLILEDDFHFVLEKTKTFELLNDFWKGESPWDVLMISGNIRRYKPTDLSYLYKITNAQTTSGYAVNRNYLPILMKNFEDGINKYVIANKRTPALCIDIYWKRLQPSGNWFVINPKLGRQREGYSDIECRNTNYTAEITDIK
jgi:GR25 family glycosyltransferase involved in LPS biosynthesis